MSIKPKKGNGGWFRVPANKMQEILFAGGSFEELATYLVLLSGLNFPKAGLWCSTHGALSVHARTGLSRRDSQVSLYKLQSIEAIRLPREGEPTHIAGSTGLVPIRWIIDADGRPAVLISSLFVNRSSNGRPSPLARTLMKIREEERDFRKVISDVLTLFVALHDAQNWADWGGVNPAVWHQRLPVLSEDESAVWTEQAACRDAGLSLVSVKSRGDPWMDPYFAGEVLLAGEDSDEALAGRLATALRWLVRLGLIYRVIVLWRGDPTNVEGHRDAFPTATLYVEDAWARKDYDKYLQFKVDDAVRRLMGEDRQFEYDGSLLARHDDNYRFLVPAGTESHYTVLRQLRVRYWPSEQSTVEGRNEEAARTQRWARRLARVGAQVE